MTGIQLCFFAELRDQLGCDGEMLPCAEPTTVAAVRSLLASRDSAWERLRDHGRYRAALNHQMADESASVRAGDELAFFPPVTGG